MEIEQNNRVCSFCGRKYAGRGSLANHITKMHKAHPEIGLNERRCPKCGIIKTLNKEYFKPNASRKDGWEPWCRECFNAYYRQRMKERPELRRAKERRYAERHPDKMAAKLKRHHERLRERGYNRYENRKAWIQRTNYNMVKWRRRRALKAGARGNHTQEQFYARCEIHGWRCYYCGIPLTKTTVTEDHRIPLSRGGTDWPANLVPACLACNIKKGTLTELEFLHRRQVM